ncbi:MAG: phenylacetate--CoA ligase [Alphaproteobacteria bacterium]|jgi:phenylacetate-CoA ligase|nr:phenylacetate--CoA ligase [Alphaproteobacteria bacterium]
MTADFMYQPELEQMPRAELEALQLTRLQATLEHAYGSMAFYRRHFDASGITPEDVKHLDDVARLPFTVKSDLRDHYPFGFFAVAMSELRRIHASSGTSGSPTVVGYSARDLDTWAELMARSMAAGGVRPGDIVHNAYGYGLFTGGLGFHDGGQRLGCAVVPVSSGNTERQIKLLVDFGARVICATPSYALNIAEVAAAMGVDLAAAPLAVGCHGAEPWSEGLRQAIEAGLGVRAVDCYGLSEIMGPGVAMECTEAQAGQHVWEDHFLVEIIDPESGEVLPAGAEGELVITTLTKEAMPMIRYRTRDITRLVDEPCICGRSHRRLARITGRSDDMLIIRGVNVYPSEIEAHLVGLPHIAPYYQLVLSREGAMDTLTVEVEATAETAAETYAAIADEVAGLFRTRIGLGCTVEVKAPGEVPRSEGKAVRVRDLRAL